MATGIFFIAMEIKRRPATAIGINATAKTTYVDLLRRKE
jgi:hypothetical protein